MPIIETNSGYGYVYRKDGKKKFKLPIFFKLLLIILSIIIILFFALLLSNNIQSFIGINKNAVFTKKQIYAISVGNFNDYNTANVLAESLKKQGGAGYIKNNNNNYIVLLSAYNKKDDALKVISNLIENNVEAEIYNINLNDIIIDKKIDKKERDIIIKVVNSFYNSYIFLNNLSLEYDSKKLTKSEIIEQIDKKTSNLIENNENFNKNYVNSENAFYVYLKVYSSRLIEIFDNIKLIDNNFSGELKKSYFDCLNLFLEFSQEIQ